MEQSQSQCSSRDHRHLQPWTPRRRAAIFGDHADSETDSSAGGWMGSLYDSDSSCPSSPRSLDSPVLSPGSQANWPTSPSDAGTVSTPTVPTPDTGSTSGTPAKGSESSAAATGAALVASVAAGGGVRKRHSMQWSYSGDDGDDESCPAAAYSTTTMSSNSSTASSTLAGMPFVAHPEAIELLSQQCSPRDCAKRRP